MRVKTVPRQRILQQNTHEESRNIASKVKNGTESGSNDEEEESVNSTMDNNHRECDSGNFERNDDSSSASEERCIKESVIKCTSDVYKEHAKFDKTVNHYSANDERKNESSNQSTEVLDMSNKCKQVQPMRKNLLNHCLTAGSSGVKYADLYQKEEATRLPRDDNNNANNIACDGAEVTSDEYYMRLRCYEDKDDDSSMKAINLCMKDRQDEKRVEEDSTRSTVSADEKLKDTFLYKIMTDPSFLESIQKNKQSKKYVCQFCKHDFGTSDELADHMDVKMDETNQIRCCACKKTFAQKRYLRYHQRCHSERTKFTCDICTKKYTRLDNLTRHNAFHVNPDKFSCTYCEKTFARKDLLNKHLKCHDNKHRFFCTACQKYFKGPVSLDNHNRILHAFN